MGDLVSDDDLVKKETERVYKLRSAQDVAGFYDNAAREYDLFVERRMGYLVHERVARTYNRWATALDKDVLDVGCGTGLVAQALDMSAQSIKGVDISEEMLSISEQKHLYSGLYKANMNNISDALATDFGAVVSAGSFTFGHISEVGFENLLHYARAGALFVISVNQRHFDEVDYPAMLDRMVAQKKISPPVIDNSLAFSQEKHPLSNETVNIVTFRKTE